ncbi:helix-turn-helix domain-containing protein [Carboxylicivirga linearis]|uniref:Helix-turn-helix transcriptional regulator n=1 Tax=Carboxylicivirga linearis TaxID=1628157 RepID=A0ABS5JSH3_9BACT|nr:helix-turn-helix transcriptional regulator [Carboxylicivirga linearis]MBS2097807.1 helix-turn-helix transcriptional regulator [Carboxylicivirga linearis]
MNQKSIGTRIAELRKEKGLTQNEVVEKCNINIRTLQRIESNQVQPRMYTVRALLEAMDYDLDILSEPNQTNPSANLKQKATHFFDQAGYMFNQNKSIMKKAFVFLSLALAVIFIINVAFTDKVDESDIIDSHPISEATNTSSDKKTDKMLQLIKGKWQLKVSNDYEVDNSNRRIIEFNSKGEFVTTNANGSPFNSGLYYITKDKKLFTIHNNPKGEIRECSNYYQFTVGDTELTIKGIYLRPLMNNHYETFRVDEVWVRVE